MGAYLSEPITNKETAVEENDELRVASSSMQGWRVSQEVSTLANKLYKQTRISIQNGKLDVRETLIRSVFILGCSQRNN